MGLADYKSALVTGASSGIGQAVVRMLTRRGLKVHALARRRNRLDALAAETGCLPCPLDLRETAEIYRLVEAMDVEVLINNAGLGRGFGRFADATPDDLDQTLSTNVLAAAHVMRAVVPAMMARRSGHIVNIGSVAGLYPIGSTIYGGSKGALHLMSQNLRIELAGSRVRLTEICPGRVETEFFDVAVDDPEVRAAAFSELTPLSSEDIAGTIEFALDQPWHVNIGSIELSPTEQHFGGMTIRRADPPI